MGLSHAGDVAAGRLQVPVSAAFFDCLEIDGHDLRDVPLSERKQLLELLIPRGTGVLGYSAHVEERREQSPFDVGTPTGRGHHWVEPKLVAEVRFTEWTDDGGLRHPAFLGLRDDKRPRDCKRETAMPTAQAAKPTAPKTKSPASGRVKLPASGRVKITRPEKIFWPEDGFTKGDLVAYYEAIAPLMLPYLEDRPLVLVRYPDGIAGKSFFQKDTPDFVPNWVRTVR